jgi:hypothetical protein
MVVLAHLTSFGTLGRIRTSDTRLGKLIQVLCMTGESEEKPLPGRGSGPRRLASRPVVSRDGRATGMHRDRIAVCCNSGISARLSSAP